MRVDIRSCQRRRLNCDFRFIIHQYLCVAGNTNDDAWCRDILRNASTDCLCRSSNHDLNGYESVRWKDGERSEISWHNAVLSVDNSTFQFGIPNVRRRALETILRDDTYRECNKGSLQSSARTCVMRILESNGTKVILNGLKTERARQVR